MREKLTSKEFARMMFDKVHEKRKSLEFTIVLGLYLGRSTVKTQRFVIAWARLHDKEEDLIGVAF